MAEEIRKYTQRKRAKDAAIALANIEYNEELDLCMEVKVHEDGTVYLVCNVPAMYADMISGVLSLGKEVEPEEFNFLPVESYMKNGLRRFRGQ